MTETSLSTQLDTVRGWLKAQEPELAKALPKGTTPERFARIALTAVLRNPRLAESSKESFVLAIMEAAALGLEPDSVSGLAYLTGPYHNKRTGKKDCVLIIGYRGLIQLAFRHPRVSQIDAQPVYDKDVFQIALGIQPKLVHIPMLNEPGGRGELIGAYAWARISGGGRPFVYMPRAEIEEHRARSRSKDDGPWITDFVAMCVKTPVRALCKRIPLSPQLQHALSVDADPENESPLGPPHVPSETGVSEILDAIAESGNTGDDAA
jgi:recombination protein RecT